MHSGRFAPVFYFKFSLCRSICEHFLWLIVILGYIVFENCAGFLLKANLKQFWANLQRFVKKLSRIARNKMEFSTDLFVGLTSKIVHFKILPEFLQKFQKNRLFSKKRFFFESLIKRIVLLVKKISFLKVRSKQLFVKLKKRIF